MRHTLKIFFLIATILVCTIVLTFTILVPKLTPWAEAKVREFVMRGCKSCEFAMGPVTLGWDGLALGDFRLSGGNPKSQRVEFRARRVIISPVWFSLITDQPRIRGITLDHPDVLFIDGEEKSKSKPMSALEPGAMEVTVENIFLHNGKFTYERNVKGTHAVLVVQDIIGDIDPNPELATARLQARIGGDGSINVVSESPLTKKPLEITSDIQVRGQDLAALSVFFKPNAGVELWGMLTKGHARTKLVGTHLTASLWAEYEGFKLKVDKMYDRNELQTFFTNLGAEIGLRSQNENLPTEEQMKTVELDREAEESIMAFTLRGLKQAALGVAL